MQPQFKFLVFDPVATWEITTTGGGTVKRPINRLGLCLFLLPCCMIHDSSFRERAQYFSTPQAPSKVLPVIDCPPAGIVDGSASDQSWALNRPFTATVQFTGTSSTLDLSSLVKDDAFMCFTFAHTAPPCNVVQGTASLACGDNSSAHWPCTAISAIGSSRSVKYTFTTSMPPQGHPDGTGKGIVIITKTEGGSKVQFRADGDLTIRNPP